MNAKRILNIYKSQIPKTLFKATFSSLCGRSVYNASKRTSWLISRSYGAPKHEQLVIESYGEPEDVVKKVPLSIPEKLQDRQVLAKVLASPINPADINTILGSYAVKPTFPFIPGNEAVLEILDIGKSVDKLKVGDRVLPRLNNMGTFRTALIADEAHFIKVPSDIDIIAASTLGVNPCTAFRMITDFVTLKPGDVLIQNLANSAVGQAVIQIAADKGIQTINIARERPNFNDLKTFLTSLGATLVIPDSEIRHSKDLIDKLPKPLLGFNGVCGKDGAELLRLMADGGTVVTYGGMSRQPFIVPVGSMIFNDLILRGFWMSRWSQLHETHPQRDTMFDYLFDMIRRKKLTTPAYELVPFEDYKQAFPQVMPSKGMVGKKQILIFK